MVMEIKVRDEILDSDGGAGAGAGAGAGGSGSSGSSSGGSIDDWINAVVGGK